jgi:hypothetical protein
MLRGIILSDSKAGGKFVDGRRLPQEFVHQAPSCTVGESLQQLDAGNRFFPGFRWCIQRRHWPQSKGNLCGGKSCSGNYPSRLDLFTLGPVPPDRLRPGPDGAQVHAGMSYEYKEWSLRLGDMIGFEPMELAQKVVFIMGPFFQQGCDRFSLLAYRPGKGSDRCFDGFICFLEQIFPWEILRICAGRTIHAI